MKNIKDRIKALGILLVVPTYNNAGTILGVLESIKLYTEDILLVNDGSTDDTLNIVSKAGVKILSYEKNRGKGYAIRQSFKYAKEEHYSYVLTMDSDGQHYAFDILSFVEQIEKSPDSLLIGARNLTADNMPKKNTFANKFSNFWYMVETGAKLDDTQSGYRIYPMKSLGGMRFFANRYEFEVEVIVRAAWRGVDVRNIGIKVYYPPENERVSHFKPLKDFSRISVLNTILVSLAIIYYYPLKLLRWVFRRGGNRA